MNLKIIKATLYSSLSKKPRIHFFAHNESILEDLTERYSRPYHQFKQTLPKLKSLLNLPTDIKVKWSQYAGCKCGCSPGFIIQNANELNLSQNISVDYVIE
jgi:hypothetical protein